MTADVATDDGADGPATPPGAPAGPRTVPEADAFRFDRVERSGGSSDDPPVRRGMTLFVDERGISSSGPRRRRKSLLPWSDVTRISVGEETPAAGGSTEVPIEVESLTGRFRYVVRSDHPLSVAMSALEVQVHRWGPPLDEAPAATVPAEWAVPAVRAVPDESAPPLPPPQTVPSLPVPLDPADSPSGMPTPHPVALAPVPVRSRRTRRTVTLVVALSLLVSGIGLGVGLSLSSTPSTSTSDPGARPGTASADQRLADQLMLVRSDLPTGWQVAQDGGATANSPAVQQGQATITATLAHCMGISDAQASVVLGGRAADQTAQASSPIFVAPTASASSGSALELQSAATVVRTHADELADFALLSNPRYPQCEARAAAADLQLGVDQTSKGSDQPGPATVSPVTFPGPDGVQTNALLMAFSVKAGAASVSVQVESIWLGSRRVEANLQIFAIGGQVPGDTVLGPITTFQDRVASGGRDSTV